MIIIRIIGGLGNQLFQYALYKEFEYRNVEVRADLSLYDSTDCIRPYCLPELGLAMKKASKAEIRRLCGDDSSFWNKVLRKTAGRKRYLKEKFPRFEPALCDFKDKYLNGYWQNENYFRHAAGALRSEIHFPVLAEGMDETALELIRKKNTTSIHVRLGDYENHPTLGGVCTEEYYNRAANYIRTCVKNTEFIVFSNDIDKARQMFGGEHFHYVRHEGAVPDYVDMYLMSKCSQNIIANSTFSWWGAWLNQNRNKIVVAPEKWLNTGEGSCINCGDWITIKN